MSSDQQIIYLSKTIDQKNHSLTELKNLTAKNELYLDFLDECWIELYVDDELIEALYFDENDNYKKKIENHLKLLLAMLRLSKEHIMEMRLILWPMLIDLLK